jgi:glycosidase
MQNGAVDLPLQFRNKKNSMPKQINQDDIIYFIVTDRFFGRNKRTVDTPDRMIHGGTLDGILEKLEYLTELGITAIWITPVYKNIQGFFDAEPYHYYWAENFDQIDERLLDGSQLPTATDKSTLAEFITRCESEGIKVIVDMVINHAGYGAEANFDASWFNHGTGDIKGQLSGLPDFNHDKPEVLDYFVNNIQDWIIEGGVNNIRMDTVKHVEPKFWHFFKSQIRGEYPEVTLIGEVLCEGKDEVDKLLEYQNFHDFNSIFDFPLATAIRQTFIYDGKISEWLARPRLHDAEPMGVLDNDNPLKGGYRNANALVTLVDNHDLEKRIISHARTKHPGDEEGLAWAIKVNRLCLAALFTFRGIPQLYYGTEIGLEGWKADGDDKDLRRDFPWGVIDNSNRPKSSFKKETEMYAWTKDLINLRKQNAAFRYGTTVTLWADHLVYAFLRISLDDVAFVIFNNGYTDMQFPISLYLNPNILSPRNIELIKTKLLHWKNGTPVTVTSNYIIISVAAKSVEIYCGKVVD